MQITNLEDIITRVRAQCASNRWYGAGTTQPHGKSLTDEPVRTHFQFPPITDEQVAQTEAWLGFALPPVLHVLYMRLANGGFGPGAGLRGAAGGYGTMDTPMAGTAYLWQSDETLVKYHRPPVSPMVDIALDEQWHELELPYDAWPRQLFPLCNLGDMTEICADKQGDTYLLVTSTTDPQHKCTLIRKEEGIEQWLVEEWLRATP